MTSQPGARPHQDAEREHPSPPVSEWRLASDRAIGPRTSHGGRLALGALVLVVAAGRDVALAGSRPRPRRHLRPLLASVPAGEGPQAITVDTTLQTYSAGAADPTGRRLPLVLNFHRYDSDAVQQAVYSQLERPPRPRCLVAAPQGAGTRFSNISPKLASPTTSAPPQRSSPTFEASGSADPRRVHVTRFSNGARLLVPSAPRSPAARRRRAVTGVDLYAGCPDPGPPSPCSPSTAPTTPTSSTAAAGPAASCQIKCWTR